MTPETATRIYRDLLEYSRGISCDVKIFADSFCAFIKERQWEKGWHGSVGVELIKAPSLVEFIQKPAPDGIGQNVEWIIATLKGPSEFYDGAKDALLLLDEELEQEGFASSGELFKSAVRRARVEKPLAEHGANQHRGGDNVTSTKSDKGNNAEYLTRRLARDFPDIAERLANGEFKSVRSACKAAGIVRDLTPFEQLQRAWSRADEEERERFRAWIIVN